MRVLSGVLTVRNLGLVTFRKSAALLAKVKAMQSDRSHLTHVSGRYTRMQSNIREMLDTIRAADTKVDRVSSNVLLVKYVNYFLFNYHMYVNFYSLKKIVNLL